MLQKVHNMYFHELVEEPIHNIHTHIHAHSVIFVKLFLFILFFILWFHRHSEFLFYSSILPNCFSHIILVGSEVKEEEALK